MGSSALHNGLDKPTTLYKYYEVKDFLPKILKGEALRFSCPFDFNDPFESNYFYELYDPESYRHYAYEVVKNRGLNPSQRVSEASRLMRLLQKKKLLQPQQGDATRSMIQEIGVFCLSELKDSILMWSHYAKDHKGICIGFDMKESLFRQPFKVVYQSEFPVINLTTDTPDSKVEKVLCTKAHWWSYEKEWRIFRHTMTEESKQKILKKAHFSEQDKRMIQDVRGPGDYQFLKDAITEIYLGARISEPDKTFVMQAIRDAELNIPVYQAKLNPQKYCLDFVRVTGG